MAAQTTPLVALVTKFGGGLPAGMLLAHGSADNVFGDPFHQVWCRAPCWNTDGRWRRRQRLWRPSSSSLAAGSLRGCCWSTATKTTPLVTLAIKFGVGLSAGMLLANCGADNTFSGPGHQFSRGDPCQDAVGQQRRLQRCRRPSPSSLAMGSLLGC